MIKPAYNSLPYKTGPHTGGIVRMHVAPKEWLTSDIIVDFETNQVVNNITLAAGRSWLSLGFTAPSFEYDQEPKTDKRGDYYEVHAAGTLNNYDHALQQTLETLRYHQLIGIITDREKRQRLVGNAEKGFKNFNRHAIKNSPGETSVALKFLIELADAPPFISLGNYINLPGGVDPGGDGGGDGGDGGTTSDPVFFDGDGYYDLPANTLLEQMIILPGANTNVKLGFTAGGEEIRHQFAVIAATGKPEEVNIYNRTATTRIYIAGLNTGSAIIFLTRQMPT